MWHRLAQPAHCCSRSCQFQQKHRSQQKSAKSFGWRRVGRVQAAPKPFTCPPPGTWRLINQNYSFSQAPLGASSSSIGGSEMTLFRCLRNLSENQMLRKILLNSPPPPPPQLRRLTSLAELHQLRRAKVDNERCVARAVATQVDSIQPHLSELLGVWGVSDRASYVYSRVVYLYMDFMVRHKGATEEFYWWTSQGPCTATSPLASRCECPHVHSCKIIVRVYIYIHNLT